MTKELISSGPLNEPIPDADAIDIGDITGSSFKSKLLRPNVEWKSFCIFLLSVMMSICGLVFINAAQSYVIIDILEYPRAKLGFASGTLAFADELLCVPMVSFWGFLSDRFGRRIIISSGLLIMSFSTYLYPWATSVFPSSFSEFFRSLLFFRLIFACGGSATTAMMTALIGDFSLEQSRAKVAGFTGTAAGLGALMAALFFARLPIMFSKGCVRWLALKRPDIVITYSTTSFCMFITAALAYFFIIVPVIRLHMIPWSTRVKTGILAIKQPIVALAYLTGFVARADSIALNLFISPWIDNYLTRLGLCPPVTPDTLVRCEPAKRLTSNLMSTSHLATLLGAPLFGIVADRLGPVPAVALPALLGCISFGLLSVAENPKSAVVFMAMFTSGLADIGMIITSMALIASQSSPSQRGALAGVYSLFGAVGIIVTSKVGGYLFDSYNETSSFAVVFLSNGALLVCVLLAMAFRHRIGH